MTHRTLDEEMAKLLSYCQSRFQPICQRILNIDLSEKEGSKSNGLTQLSHDSPIDNTLYNLLDSATMPVEESFVKIMNLPKINHKVLTDPESIKLKDLSIQLLCELEKLPMLLPLQWQNIQLYQMRLGVSFYVFYLLLKIRLILSKKWYAGN